MQAATRSRLTLTCILVTILLDMIGVGIIVPVLPELLDSNGDAANARVLAARARWAGIAGVDVVRLGDDWSSLTAAPARRGTRMVDC